MTPEQVQELREDLAENESGAWHPDTRQRVLALCDDWLRQREVVEAARFYANHFSREVGTNSLVEALAHYDAGGEG